MNMCKSKKTILITERDDRILIDLSNNVFSSKQIKERHFPSDKRASKRLKALYDSGLVRRFPQPFIKGRGKGEYIYFLSVKGKNLLEQYLGRKVSLINPLKDVYSLPHRIMIGDFHITFEKLSSHDFSTHFYYPKECDISHGDLNGLVPDGIAIVEKISAKKAILHFLEADCSSEALMTKGSSYSIARKMEKYQQLFDNRTALEYLNKKLGFNFNGFRVLFVASEAKRLQSMMKISAGLNAEFIWFARHEYVTAGKILDSIWSNFKYSDLSLIASYPNNSRRDNGRFNRRLNRQSGVN